MKVLGLIGGIGSGKSRVAEELVRRGGYLISGDRLGHEGLRQPEIRRQIVGRWGAEILKETGEIDRRKLGAIVFGRAEERQTLESFVFPYIERRIIEEIESCKRNPVVRLVVLDAAVMLEAGWNKHCDRLVFVDAPRETRLQRLVQNRGWSDSEVQAREQAQWPLSDKKRQADFVIDNSGTPEHLARQIDELLQKLGVDK